MEPTRAILRPQPVRSKTFMSPEIAKGSSTPRSLIATVAMNRKWPRGSHRCLWPE